MGSNLRNRRILVIDDSESIHHDFRAILQPKNKASELESIEEELFPDISELNREKSIEQTEFDIDVAFQGDEGVDKVISAVNSENPYSIAFVDIRMPPGIDGVVTVGKLWEIDPDLQIVLCSAFSDYSWDEINRTLKKPDNLVILKKPFENIEVRQLASALTEKWIISKQIAEKIKELEIEIGKRKKSESELDENRKRLQDIMDNAAAVIYVKDVEGRYILVNRMFEQLFHITNQKIFGKKDSSVFPAETARNLRANDQVVLQNNRSTHFEETIPVNGINRIYISIKYPMINSEGKVYGICGMSTDITNQKQAEKKFRGLLESGPDAMVVVNKDGEIVLLNSETERLFGYKREELLGKTVEVLVPERFRTKHVTDRLGYLNNPHRTGLRDRPELSGVGKDGREFPVEISLSPVETEGGLLVYAAIRDVTDRLRIEKELLNTKNYLDNIINSMPSVIVGVNEHEYVTHWNHEAEKKTGISAEQAKGKLFENVMLIDSGFVEILRRGLMEKLHVKSEKYINMKGGKISYFDLDVYPMNIDGEGGAVLRIDDVTIRVQLEDLLIQTEKMMSIGGLAAGIAHEINNPLAGIIQNIQVMHNRMLPDLDKNRQVAEACGTTVDVIWDYMGKRGILNMIESVQESGKRAAKIVENMLSFSRKGESRIGYYHLYEILDTTLELASNDYDLKKKYDFRKIKIIREYEAALPKIPCEESKIQQVFLNLLKNGAQAMAEQKDMHEQPQFILRIFKEKAYARIEIEDNGPGMDEQVIKRVFEPFFTTKEQGVGTGLGLSVSFFIITENHHGKMLVESVPGKGAKFIILLPLEDDTDIVNPPIETNSNPS